MFGNCRLISSVHIWLPIDPLHAGDGVEDWSGQGDSGGSNMEGVTESGRKSWLFPLVEWEKESR